MPAEKCFEPCKYILKNSLQVTPYYNSPAFLFKPDQLLVGYQQPVTCQAPALSARPAGDSHICLAGPWDCVSLWAGDGTASIALGGGGGKVPAGHGGLLSSLLIETQGPSEVPLILDQ